MVVITPVLLILVLAELRSLDGNVVNGLLKVELLLDHLGGYRIDWVEESTIRLARDLVRTRQVGCPLGEQ